jgi:hypothetical protein
MNGYLGLVPDSTQTGDLVCVLFGGRMPFILRETKEYHVFVGDSYVHGLTCGESMRDFERGLYEGEVFNTE